MNRTSIGLAIAIAMWTGAASADDGEGAFRLSLSGDLFGWERTNLGPLRVDGSPPLSFGSSSELLRYGFIDPRLGIDVGGALTPEVLIGITGGVARTAQYTAIGEVERVEWLAQAWIEGVFLHGDDIRPFVRGSIGAGGIVGWRTRERAVFAMALTAGAHFFASDDVSISPWLRLGYQNGIEEAFETTTSAPGEHPIEIVTVTLGVSLAGWIGGEDELVPERRAEYDEAAIGRSRQRTTAPPPPTRSARPTAPDADTFRSDLRITGTARSLLTSRPSVDGRNIRFGLSVISASPRFAGCQTMELVAERARVTVPMRVTQQPFHRDVEETIVLTATHAQLEVLAGAQPRLIACGETIELDLSVRAAIGAYIQRFRAMAQAAGTLDPGVFVQPEPRPAEVPGAGDEAAEEDAGAPVP